MTEVKKCCKSCNWFLPKNQVLAPHWQISIMKPGEGLCIYNPPTLIGVKGGVVTGYPIVSEKMKPCGCWQTVGKKER